MEIFQGKKVNSLEAQLGLFDNILLDLLVVQGDLVPGLPNLVGGITYKQSDYISANKVALKA